MHILRKLTQNAVKATAAWLDISLILQLLLAPALFVLSPQPVIAATEPQVAFSYNADASEFSLQVEPIAEVDYTVTYTTSHGIADGFQDGGPATDGVYRATRIAGTTSSEHDTHYGVEAGSLKVVGVKQEGGEFRFERDFTIQDGQLVWDFETVDEPGYWSQVELGQTYQAVEDNRVSVTFTELTDPAGDLRIRQVELSDEQVADLGALTNIAYEITSSMEDGTFAYDLTLPNPQPEKKATIQYSEDGTTFNDAGEEEHFADTVTVRGLDHFTLFVVVDVPDCDSVYVPNTGCYDENSLDVALANSSDGGEIILSGDVYLDATLEVNKSITIRGINNATVHFSGSGYGFHVKSDDVTLQNFTFTNQSGTATYGLKIAAEESSNTTVDNPSENILLENLTVENFGRSNIDLNGVDNATLTNITASGTPYGVGIALTDSNRIYLSNLTTFDNAWAGLAVYARGAHYPPAESEEIFYSGTMNLGETTGFYSSEHAGAEGTIEVTFQPGTDFSGSTSDILIANGSTNNITALSVNWGESSADAIEERIVHDCEHSPFLTGACNDNDLSQEYGSVQYLAAKQLNAILECVAPQSDGEGYTAFFGYENNYGLEITIPVGPNNKITGGGTSGLDQGQTTTFAYPVANHPENRPGRTPFFPEGPAAFSVDFNGSNLVWTLNGKTATASQNSKACPDQTISGTKFFDQNGTGEWDEGENGLAGWTIKAVHPESIATLQVDATEPDGASTSLVAGKYLVIATGSWYNRNNPQERYDAEYGTLNGWTTFDDGLDGYGEDFGDLLINDQFQEWGPYSTSHTYYLNINHAGGDFTASVFDGLDHNDHKVPGWYRDNHDGVTVTVYRVIDEAVTDVNGEYQLSLPVTAGTVHVYEIPQRDWVQTYPTNPNYHVLTLEGNGADSVNFGNQLSAIQFGSLTVCKEDPNANRLAGWNFQLTREPVQTLTIDSSDQSAVLSEALTNGMSYDVEVSGTWVNTGDRLVDAEYFSDDNWSTTTDMGTEAGRGLRQLDLIINEANVDWGSYSGNHTYTTTVVGDGSPLSFRIYDEDNAGKNPKNWYRDNQGSLTVNIFPSAAESTTGTSGQDGCYTFENVLHGEYSLTETQQDGWEFEALYDGESKLEGNRITVDEDAENFTFVNADNQAPVVEITSHDDDDIVEGSFELAGLVQDVNLSHYWFVIENEAGQKKGGPGTKSAVGPSVSPSFTWNSVPFGDGLFTAKLEARDAYDNKDPNQKPLNSDPEVDGDSVDWVELKVNNLEPVSTFTQPNEDTTWTGPITIAGETTDYWGVSEVVVSATEYVDGLCVEDGWEEILTFNNDPANSPFAWSDTWLPENPGVYCLKAQGTDGLGKQENTQIIPNVEYAPMDILSGYKFHDLNQNGDWDEGEPALEGWTINASVITREETESEEQEASEVVTSTEYASNITDENGYYEFEVPVGEYEVSETQQEGWTQTAPTDKICSFDVTDPNKREEDVQIDEEGRYTCNFGNYLLPVPTPTPVADLGGGNSSNNGGGFSAPGPADPPVCSANAPGIPVGLSVTNATANTVTLNWTRPEGDVTHYALEFIRLSDGARYGAAKIGDGNTTSYTITNLSGQAAYRFELMAVNDCKPGERAVVTSTQITGPVINEADAGRPQGDDGQVLGSSTDESVENADGEIASGVSDNKGLLGSVLGASTENCSVPGWWWLILVGYVLGMMAVYALLEKRARLVGAIVVTLAAAAGLYWTLCMPWIWIAIVVAASILIEGGRYLMAGQGKDPFAHMTTRKQTKSPRQKSK